VKYEVTKEEFSRTLRVRGQEFCFPLPLLQGNLTPESAMERIFLKQQWQFESSFAQNINPPTTECVDFDVYNSTSSIDGYGLCISVKDDLSYVVYAAENRGRDRTYSFASFFASKLPESIYAFDAVRANSHIIETNSHTVLETDARNLAYVLQSLQNNQFYRERYNQAVRAVLPQIELVTVEYNTSTPLRIMVHRAGLPLDRKDLQIPLSDCGTGISQVLAMLYVVVTSLEPRIIIIDEPNSFLHPGAVRSLIEVLKIYDMHQYIITTHSPAIIAACDPATLTLIEQTDGVSDFKQLDAKQRTDQELVLAAVGADFSDVFGVDNLLWVEGQTEEKAFPLIIKHFVILPSTPLVILPVPSTADFAKKSIKIVDKINRWLLKANSLLPKTINFLLDSETLRENEKMERKEVLPTLHFLPRRMYENYLLIPEAIASVANSTAKLIDKQITASMVQAWLDQHSHEAKYYHSHNPHNADWHKDIDGASLLEDMFKEFYGDDHDYEKIRDSVALTKWLLENDSVALQEIADLLKQIIEPVQPAL